MSDNEHERQEHVARHAVVLVETGRPRPHRAAVVVRKSADERLNHEQDRDSEPELAVPAREMLGAVRRLVDEHGGDADDKGRDSKTEQQALVLVEGALLLDGAWRGGGRLERLNG